MRAARLALCVAVAGSLAATSGVGHAATKKKPAPKPKPVCNLVTDSTGDASFPAGTPTNDAIDVVSADVAANASSLTGVIRVKKLAATSTSAPSGMAWEFDFDVEGTSVSLIAHASPAGAVTYDAAYTDEVTGNGSFYAAGTTGVFDLAKNEVRITAPVGLLQTNAPLGTTSVLENFRATGGAEVAVTDPSPVFNGTVFSNSFQADEALGSKTYKVGTPSCVKPGA